MLLSVGERFLLMDVVLGQKGNLVTMGVMRKIVEKLEFSLEEMELYRINQLPDGRLSWSIKPDVSPEKAFDFSEKQVKFIADILAAYPMLTAKHFSLLEKFGVQLPEEE